MKERTPLQEVAEEFSSWSELNDEVLPEPELPPDQEVHIQVPLPIPED